MTFSLTMLSRLDVARRMAPAIAHSRSPPSPSKGVRSTASSARDAQLLLDVGHHRMSQARLAKFRKIFGDDAVPKSAVLFRHVFALMRKVERFGFFSAPSKPERMRPVRLDREVVWPERMRALGAG